MQCGRTPKDLARRYPKVIKELEKYVPGASSRLTTAKDPKPKYMTTSSEHSMVEKHTLPTPSSSSERPHPRPEHRPTSPEHSMVEKHTLPRPSSSSDSEHPRPTSKSFSRGLRNPNGVHVP